VREPNVPATMLEIHDGLVAVSQNRFPSLAFDVGASTSWAASCSAPASTTRPSWGR
jgi:hypothetical protein